MVRSAESTGRAKRPPPARRPEQRVELLNSLLTLNRNAETGFEKAATLAESTTLRGLFERAMLERAAFARALRPLVRDAGGEPDDAGSTDASVSRLWMQVRQKLSRQGDDVLIEECRRAEDESVTAYRDALDADLPGPVHAVLEVQATRVFATHDALSGLKHDRADR